MSNEYKEAISVDPDINTVAELFEPESDDDTPLAEEIADTATIQTIMDSFIEEISIMFVDAIEVSLEGNSVRTHIELMNLGQDTVDLAHNLKRELVAKLANRADVIVENGDMLRTQVNPPEVRES